MKLIQDIWKSIIVLFVCAAMTGCATTNKDKGEMNPNQVTEFPKISGEALALKFNKDTVRKQDVLDIRVFGLEELSGIFVVGDGGDIYMPLLGKVSAAGKTREQLQSTLISEYSESYLNNPAITVRIEERELGKIVVDGAVREPGVFEVPQTLSMTEAIALAKGTTPTANPNEVFLIRDFDGRRKVLPVDLASARIATGPDPDVVPGDVIFVGDSLGRRLFDDFLKTVPLLNTAIIFSRR